MRKTKSTWQKAVLHSVNEFIRNQKIRTVSYTVIFISLCTKDMKFIGRLLSTEVDGRPFE